MCNMQDRQTGMSFRFAVVVLETLVRVVAVECLVIFVAHHLTVLVYKEIILGMIYQIAQH